MGNLRGNLHYTRELIEEAVKLGVQLNGRWTLVQKELAVRYPDRPPPNTETIKNWTRKFEKLGERRGLSSVRNNPMEMWHEVELAALDRIIDEVKAGRFTGQILSKIAGIAAEKRLRTMELEKGKTQNIKIYQLIEDRRIELARQLEVHEIETRVLTKGSNTGDGYAIEKVNITKANKDSNGQDSELGD